ncbi:efflux RND transporter periplasmic adaptor subunit [Leptobacterium sp. I13]|uniref:efflux RND transporter periplasmic adaptor subunit n=1 Tax=Leptobacterium meishanense TaxID=3128904 RepID=UPI0030ED5C46
MRKIILSVLGIALIILSIFLAKLIIDSKKKPKPRENKITKTVFADTITNGEVPIVIKSQGTLTAKRRIELFSEVQGVFRKSSRPFLTGQLYKQGETLLYIDNAEYYASVQAQKSNLYNIIAAAMPDIRLDFSEAYPKWQQYFNNFDIDKPVSKLPEAASDKEKYFIAGRNITGTYYNIKNLEQRLSKYTISAPFTGILTEASVREGTLIRNGQKLGEFIDPSVYELEVSVSKSYSDFLKTGAKVTMYNFDNTKTWEGIIKRINGRVDQQSQTIQVFIEVLGAGLREGMYLQAALNTKNETNAVEISRTLLLDNKEIFIVKDSMLQTLPVKPVYFSEKKAVVKGIPDGTIILARPVPGAYSGMQVSIYKSEEQ